MTADIADGLDLYAASTRDVRSRKLEIGSLVYLDFVSFSPTTDAIAITSGGGRETWENKGIALIDFATGEPSVKILTEPSVSAQTPAWSPDGSKLAWCEAPTPSRESRRNGPFMSAEDDAVRHRRIWVTDVDARGRSTPITNDARYFDEEPIWSRDGSHILFCRHEVKDVRARANLGTIWMMRNDGSDARLVAGPLEAPIDVPQLERSEYWYYGYTNWRGLFDWWQAS